MKSKEQSSNDDIFMELMEIILRENERRTEMENNNWKYVLKVHVQGVTYTDGPYDAFEEAMEEMTQLVNGDVNTFLTQKGSTVMLSDRGPDSVEVIRFQKKSDKEDVQGD